MTIEKALVALLRSLPPVIEAVGDRVFHLQRPESGPAARLPAIVLERTEHEPVRSMDGAAGLARSGFDVEFYADSYTSVVELAEAVRLWLDDFRGTVLGMLIKDVRLSGTTDIGGPPVAGRSVPVFVRMHAASIWHSEAKPIRG